MARKRMIDPSIWTSESFMALKYRQRLLFIGLMSHADDHGKLKANPKSLKAKIFPGDPISPKKIEDDLEEISDTDHLILLYEVEGKKYIKLPEWEKYQKMNYKTDSIIPEPNH